MKLLIACYEADEIRDGWKIEGNREEIPPFKLMEAHHANVIIKVVKSRVTPMGFIKFTK